jgi:hypothetical protein
VRQRVADQMRGCPTQYVNHANTIPSGYTFRPLTGDRAIILSTMELNACNNAQAVNQCAPTWAMAAAAAAINPDVSSIARAGGNVELHLFVPDGAALEENDAADDDY